MNDGEAVAIHDNQLPGSAERWLDTEIESGIEYRYWLEVVDNDGLVSRFGPTEPVQIEPKRLVLSLDAPYPSPAHDVVTISYTLPNNCSVELAVYDLSGRRVATLVHAELTAGRHEVAWDCVEVPSGVYLYRLSTETGSVVNRLVIAR